jgi:hypothetical protein
LGAVKGETIMRKTFLMLMACGLACTILGLTACTEIPLEPQGVPLPMDAPLLHQMSGMNVVQMVSGNGHLIDRPVERTVTFNIRKHADGTVKGWYHSVARGPGGAHIRVRMECLHVVGNQAWAVGTVVAAVNPDNIGRPYSVRFVDNGEGANVAPDEIGVRRFEYYDCAGEPDISLRPLITGNLQILE